MHGIDIRGAVREDVEAIAVFQTECWQEAYRGIVPDSFLDAMNLEVRTGNWRRRIEHDERRVVIARCGGAVAGVVSWTPGAVAELNTLYVSERARGTGLAARLLAASIANRPAALGVFSANTRARRFYAKHDFRPAGVHQVDEETGIEEERLERVQATADARLSNEIVSRPGK